MVVIVMAKNKVGKWHIECRLKEEKNLEGIRKVTGKGPTECWHVSKY